MALPEITEPSVRPTALRVPEAGPNAFGAGIGQALQQVSQEGVAIAVNERHLAAAFDAQDRELKYGVAHDRLKQAYEEQIRTLQAPDAGSFQQQAVALRDNFARDQEELRAKYEGSLTDPLARKAYQTRTRLQTQMAERQMLIFSDAHIREWRDAETNKKIGLEVERSGNVSNILSEDLPGLQLHREAAHDAILLRLKNGMPGGVPAAEAQMREVDRKMAANVYKAYDERQNHDAALGFLDAKLPDGTSVTFDPKNPDAPYLFTSAESQSLRNHAVEGRAAKAGAGLGLELKRQGFTTATAEKELFKRIDAGEIDYATADKALSQIHHLFGEEHAARVQQAEEHTKKLVNDLINSGMTLEEYRSGHSIPQDVDLSHVLVADDRAGRYASRSVVANTRASILDTTNAGWSLSIPLPEITQRLTAARVPVSEIKAVQAAWAKDRVAAVADTKSENIGHAVGEVKAFALGVLGYGQSTGKGDRDVKKPWENDVITMAEHTLYRRVAESQGKNGKLSAAETMEIANQVIKEIPGWKDKAKSEGKLDVPEYQPRTATEPTQTQKEAAFRVREALASSGASAAPARPAAKETTVTPDQIKALKATLKPGEVMIFRKGAGLGAVPKGEFNPSTDVEVN